MTPILALACYLAGPSVATYLLAVVIGLGIDAHLHYLVTRRVEHGRCIADVESG